MNNRLPMSGVGMSRRMKNTEIYAAQSTYSEGFWVDGSGGDDGSSSDDPEVVVLAPSNTPSAGGTVLKEQNETDRENFEVRVEDQLRRIRLRMFLNKNKALGGRANDILNDVKTLQNTQHDIFTRHVNGENTFSVGSINNTNDRIAEEMSKRMRSREENALKLVGCLDKLDSDIYNVVAKIEESKIGDETQEWSAAGEIDVTDDDDSDEFMSCNGND